MIISKTFAKARNANYVEPLARPVSVSAVPQVVIDACLATGMAQSIVLGEKTMWIDQSTLDSLDAAIDRRPHERAGLALDVMGVCGIHAIYGEDAPGRRVASTGIHRVNGGALVTFGYM